MPIKHKVFVRLDGAFSVLHQAEHFIFVIQKNIEFERPNDNTKCPNDVASLNQLIIICFFLSSRFMIITSDSFFVHAKDNCREEKKNKKLDLLFSLFVFFLLNIYI